MLAPDVHQISSVRFLQASESDTDDVEESSDTNTHLNQFREKWQAEIQNRGSPVPKNEVRIHSF